MNRLNRMCDLEEKEFASCIEAGHCIPFHDEYHRIRDAIRYNSKESTFYGRLEKTRQNAENYINALINEWYPNLTDWELKVGTLLEGRKREKR